MSAHGWFDHFTARGCALLQQGTPYHAQQRETGDYRPVHKPVSVSDVCAGIASVGFYTLQPDNLTRWACGDFDAAPDGFTAQEWASAARDAFDALDTPEKWLIESSPGRFHVFAFAAEPVEACVMRALMRSAAPNATEIFPKQDRLSGKPNAKGNLVRFPGFHQKRKTWSRILAVKGCVSVTGFPSPANDTQIAFHNLSKDFVTPTKDYVPRASDFAASLKDYVTQGRTYILKPDKPDIFNPLSYRNTGRGQTNRNLFRLAVALRNKGIRLGVEISDTEVASVFWSWWNVSAAHVDRTLPSQHYIARWNQAWNNSAATTGGKLTIAMKAVALIADPLERLVALCKELAAADGRFFLDCRTAGKCAGVSYRTASRWMNRSCGLEKLSVGTYGGRANEWRILPAVLAELQNA